MLYNPTLPGLVARGENLKNTHTETKKSGIRTICANTILFPFSSLAPRVGTPKGYGMRGDCVDNHLLQADVGPSQRKSRLTFCVHPMGPAKGVGEVTGGLRSV